MVVRIVIAGESQDEIFAEVCLIANYLSQQLANFCWERIDLAVLEWEPWLLRVNQSNNWHHVGSPIVWKEMLETGSKPFYIGGASAFLEYCHSYYGIDVYLAPEKLEGLTANFAQFKIKLEQEKKKLKIIRHNNKTCEKPDQTEFTVTVTGAGNDITMHIISGLLEMTIGEKSISKIYIYDPNCSREFMEFVERECLYVHTNQKKVVKYVEKVGFALTHSDLLIILDHVPFDVEQPIGDWLSSNRSLMRELSFMINASASNKMYILFPNLGPACYNATVLSELTRRHSSHIVVATSDLGIDVSAIAAEIAEVPLRNMFCPPVWGFVGVSHLVDIKTTVHRYDTFEPYNRYCKVKNSTLMIGSLTPEFRTMEYLLYNDDTLWSKVMEQKKKTPKLQIQGVNKALAVLNVVKEWLFECNPDRIVNLGIGCDGSFGLTFKGKFSQPSRFVKGSWVPAGDYLLPKDSQMSLQYLNDMAEFVMNIKEGELPNVVPMTPCKCKRKYAKKKCVWF